jgi:hypothetical protein
MGIIPVYHLEATAVETDLPNLRFATSYNSYNQYQGMNVLFFGILVG